MKILLADDHALIRSGLRSELAELEQSVEFVEAWDAETLRQMLDSHRDVDLALVDLTMPGMRGAETIGALRERFPTVPLIVLSGNDAPSEVRAVLQAGASGFIPKTAMSRLMLHAIRLVLAGGQYLPPQLMQGLGGDSEGTRANSPPGGRQALPDGGFEAARLALLSPRQKEVFALLATGLSNKMIARRLDVTEGTVKSHVATIFDVLNVHNRVSAVARAQVLHERDDKAGHEG